MKSRLFHLLLSLFVCLVSVSNISAGDVVKYNHISRPFGTCHIKYNVVQQNESYYIVASVYSASLSFTQQSTMKIRTFDDVILELPCHEISTFTYNLDGVRSIAQFKVTPEQFEEIKNGIAKVCLSMTHVNHEKTFKKDKIGKKLYKFYLKIKNNNF